MSMNNRRHPKHAAIAILIRHNRSDRSIAAELKVDRRAVARVRRIIDAGPVDTSKSLADKLADGAGKPDADGHMIWNGPISTGGIPRIRHLGHDLSVTRIVYERRTDRHPVGTVKADCGVRHCVAPTHVVDEIERRAVRLLLRNLDRRPAPWAHCRKCGGDWETHGRIQRNLEIYCSNCTAVRNARNNRKGK